MKGNAMRALRFLLVAVGASLALSGAAVGDDKEKDVPKPTKEEQQLIDLTNKERTKEKLPALKWNAVLQKTAAGHSANMVKQNKMEHELDGKRVLQRLDDIGYDYDFCGENIGLLSDLKDIPKIHEKWMKSKTHRDNIMNNKFEEIGLAIVKHPKKNEWYVTQVFGTENKK
jgi:uncharacterized protein YkwD